MSIKKVLAYIKSKNNFLITTHTNLEGDALGSVLSLYKLLRLLNKKAFIVIADKIPEEYLFLSDIEKIKKFDKNLKRVKFDCFIVLDCSDLRRTGEVYKINSPPKTILNIDHHISNERFGEINWVEPAASSTCEMIYKLYKKLNIPLDKDIALLLYVGILTDTGSFHYPNTRAFTHLAVSELLKYNLDTYKIYKEIYENIPLEDARLLSKILSGFKETLGAKVIWFQIRQSILNKNKISSDLTEHILSFGRAIKGVEVVVLFKENQGRKNEIRVNLRSQGKIDVNRIAAFFGGGGHRTASGCTIKGKIEEVTRKVLDKIKESF